GFTGTQQAWEQLVHPADRPEAVRRVGEALSRGGFEGEWRVLWPNGTLRWLAGRAWVFKDDAGRPQRLIGINIDITERKRGEEALRASEERFRSTFEQAAVGIAHVAPDGRWLRVNQKLCDMVGYGREELLQRTLQDLTYPADLDSDLALMQRVLAGELSSYAL